MAGSVRQNLTAEPHFALGVARVLGGLDLGASAPAVLWQKTDDALVGTLPQRAMGDLRLTPRLGLLRESIHGVALSLATTVGIPLGGDGALAGNGAVSVLPQLQLSRRAGAWFFGGTFGFLWRRNAASLPHVAMGNELQFGLSAAHRLCAPVELIAEANGGVDIRAGR